ncbi:hypothetical protein NVP1121O_156 [Vibrio phage 1.121.O._10N.286.46.C4]|nr:hypothetical protein NVP1121O_156 [Vibrio phage 1.121.O._10N.286.46.C4]
MNKTEKKALAEILHCMTTGDGATFETASFAEDILESLPDVKSTFLQLKSDVMVECIKKVIYSFLVKTVDPCCISSEHNPRYKEAYRLRTGTYQLTLYIVMTYTEDMPLAELEGIFEDVTDYKDAEDNIKAILSSRKWEDAVNYEMEEECLSHDTVMYDFLLGKLEEYSLVNSTN